MRNVTWNIITWKANKLTSVLYLHMSATVDLTNYKELMSVLVLEIRNSHVIKTTYYQGLKESWCLYSNKPIL